MGCFADCCLVSADDYGPAYMRWEDHPSRVDWEVLQDLGAGAFSQVVLARHRRSGRLAALKAVYLDSPDMDAPTAAMLRQEGAILSSLRHPNVVRCAEVIHGERAEVLVLEFLRGGNVLDGLYRLREGGYTERDAADIFAQLAGAVAYLHTRGVVHRDIKPENLVYARALDRAAPPPHDAHHGAPSSSTDPAPAAPSGPVVKLVDLGMALRYDPHDPQVGALGSAGFVAPEIVLGGVHTPAMDVFACGVLLFIMLVGRQPYNQAEAETLRYARLSLGAAPGLRDPRWLDLSPDAKHLLMGMLAFDPRRRLTAAQVAAHEWVATRGGVVLRPLGDDVALGAATVAEMRRLRFICGGVVGAQRRVADAAVAAAAGGKGGAGGEGSGIQGAYLEELRRMQK
jgi:serine/threonine protein kinase